MSIRDGRPRVNFAGGYIESYLVLIDELGFDREFCESDNRVAAHRAVAFVVYEEDVEIGVSGGAYDSAVHVRMAARLPHQTSAQMIVVITKIASLFEYRSPLYRRQTINYDPQRLTTRVHIDTGDASPVLRRPPVRELVHKKHQRSKLFRDILQYAKDYTT